MSSCLFPGLNNSLLAHLDAQNETEAAVLKDYVTQGRRTWMCRIGAEPWDDGLIPHGALRNSMRCDYLNDQSIGSQTRTQGWLLDIDFTYAMMCTYSNIT